MNPMAVYGAALRSYQAGDDQATLIIRREDGHEAALPVAVFFRPPDAFGAVEQAALDACRGRILDVGAGTGLHTLVLRERGLTVSAIDVSPAAVEVMAERGVSGARCTDVFELRDEQYDTLLLVGHGIGMVGSLDGLDRFLAHAHHLVRDGGQLLFDSLDVRATDDPQHLAYHQAQREAGRYIGEVRMRFEHGGERGPWCGWLQVDSETAAERATRAGWRCEVLLRTDSGDYLARLTRGGTA